MTTDNNQLNEFKTWLNHIDFDGLTCAVKSELTDYVRGLLMENDAAVKVVDEAMKL